MDDVLDSARLSSAVVYSVTFFDPDNREARPQVLKALTRETGGGAFVAKDAADVNRAFDRIAREIRSGYTIGFVPGTAAESAFRSIRVDVNAGQNRRLTARTRAGYYAGPSQNVVR